MISIRSRTATEPRESRQLVSRTLPLNSNAVPNVKATAAPCGKPCVEVIVYDNACGMVVLVRLIACPARCAARAIASRTAGVGAFTAAFKFSQAKPRASRANGSDVSFAPIAQIDSIAWHNASSPDCAVSIGGELAVSEPSTTATEGRISGCATECLWPST